MEQTKAGGKGRGCAGVDKGDMDKVEKGVKRDERLEKGVKGDGRIDKGVRRGGGREGGERKGGRREGGERADGRREGGERRRTKGDVLRVGRLEVAWRRGKRAQEGDKRSAGAAKKRCFACTFPVYFSLGHCYIVIRRLLTIPPQA